MSIRALFVGAAVFLPLSTLSSFAAVTDWMTKTQLDRFIKANMVGAKAYGTAIECREGESGGTLFRMTYEPFSGPPPFYLWQWVFGRSAEIPEIINRIRLKGEPQRKYRIVQHTSFSTRSGVEMTCAVIYR